MALKFEISNLRFIHCSVTNLVNHYRSGLGMKATLLTACALVLLAAAGPGARACDIPVFRYALENWPASPYAVYLLHRGPLYGEAAEAASLLRASSMDAAEPREGGSANLIPVELDLATTAGQAAAQRIHLAEPAALPWLAAFAPERREPGKEILGGPLNLATARRLLDSPLRREIARRLIAGDAAVWIMLESGDKTRDDKAEAALKGHIAEAARQCEAALRAAAVADGVTTPTTPLPVRFSALRAPRGDAAEAPLAAMLLGAEADLRTFKEPIVFAVMGRGRLLPALVGKGITRDNILQLSGFLTGDCTCTIKDEIPGMDLLITADWEKALVNGQRTPAEPRPALTGFAGFSDATE